MPQKRETLSTRVTRLEQLHADLTTAVKDLAKDVDAKLSALADAQIKTEERFQRTDQRIEKLVSAIGELIVRMPPPK